MKKKIEEQLAKLAFGDLEAEEAINLELRAKDDPEAARTLRMYCRMKEELRSLSLDVPADQLSKERLREAILARGLERQKAASRPTWLWMPAAAAVLAFGIVFVKGYRPVNENATPTVVDSSMLDRQEIKLPEVVIPLTVDTAAVERVAKRIAAESRGPLVALNTERPQRYKRDRIGSDRNKGIDLPGLPEDWEAMPKASDPDLLKTPDFGEKDPASETLVKRADPASQPTIVVIQPETDKDTGTLKAKEIENTANVLVGG